MRSQAFKPPKWKRRSTAGPAGAMPRNRSRKQTERALEAQLEKEANAERRRNQGASKKQKAQRDRARAAARQAITDAGLVTVPDADDTNYKRRTDALSAVRAVL